MLRKVILYNFVCFKDKISLEFKENGVYFFMGGNSTGKTCVFEAIRNCLKTTDLKQASSPCKPSADSFAACYFRTDTYQIASIYINETEGNKISKLLVATNEDDCNMRVYVAKRIDNGWENFQVGLKLDGTLQEDLNRIKNAIKKVFFNLEEDREVDFFHLYTLIFPELEKHKTEKQSFDEFIEKHVLIQMTLPHRGINPAQSNYADANQFQASSDSADVLRWYLENANDGHRTSVVHMIRQLSNGDAYTPHIENGAIEIKFDSTGKKVPLLRLPEAVVEGHVASVLLSGATPTTLCLEEPNRGMDMQTTKLLCDILKQLDHEKKLVIVATHDPYFISPWNLPNSYIFCDKRGECRIFNGQNLLSTRSDVCNIDEKVKRSITSYPMNLIWFSKRVFFVEGLSDRMFVEAIRDVIVCKGTHVGGNLLERTGLQAKPFLRLLQEFLSSLTIISIAGEGNKQKAENVCDFLEMTGKRGEQVSRYYLLDHDTLDGINKSLNLNFDALNPSFTELAKKGVFIWSVDLEKEVASFCYEENLKDLLTENHVPVTDDEPFQIKKKSKGRRKTKVGKLFLESPALTEMNIHNIVSGILSAIDLESERRKQHRKGGTVPMFLKFIIIAMLESNGQGDKLQWDGEDFIA